MKAVWAINTESSMAGAIISNPWKCHYLLPHT